MTQKYTVFMIISLLQNKSKVEQFRYYKGDFNACGLLIDLERIIQLCKLTNKQSFVVEKHFVEGYTQEEVATMLGVTQQMVEKHCRVVKSKIDKVLKEWEDEDKE